MLRVITSRELVIGLKVVHYETNKNGSAGIDLAADLTSSPLEQLMYQFLLTL